MPPDSPLSPSDVALRSRAAHTRPAIAPPPPIDHAARAASDSSLQLARICAAVSVRRRLRRGEVIARAGERFESLAWVGSGLLASCGDRVMGFHLPHDIVGLDGVADGVHPFDIRVMEEGSVRLASFTLIEQIANSEPLLLKALHRVMSHELLRQHQRALVLACPSAEGRLAAFLVDLWTRRGSVDDVHPVLLPISRADIGSYLGLTMESISRGFARLAARGLVDVRRRHLRIVDLPRLHLFAAGQVSLSPPSGPPRDVPRVRR